MKFGVRVDDEEFHRWLKITEHNFLRMTETMINVAKLIKTDVQNERVPIDTGRLSRSYKWTILSDTSRMKLLQVQMSALNPDTGYDYAYTQHLGYRHDKHGRRVWYRHHMNNLGFFNYRSDFDGGYETVDYKTDVDVVHHGGRKYLYWAINYRMDDAFELIEDDYLSLFNGVYIV